MQTHWIIQEFNHPTSNCEQVLVNYLNYIDRPVTTFKYVPFGGTDFSFLQTIQEPAVFFGTWNTLNDLRKRGISYPKPFVWCDWELFNCNTYYNKLNNFILQEDAIFHKLDDIERDWLYKNSTDLFFRPNDNEKSFTGIVIGKNRFESWRTQLYEIYNVKPDLLVVSSSVRKIYSEWRMIIVNGKVVTGSLYKHDWGLNIQPGYPQEVAEFAETVAKQWSPHPVYVLDVGATDNGYKVVEIGPFNYAGLYACDARKIVNAINDLLENDNAKSV